MSLPHQTLAHLSSRTFSTFCILSALPFLGIPFPTASTAEYYRNKNAWMATLPPFSFFDARYAGYFGAMLRAGLGVGFWVPQWRMTACAVNFSIVGVGTVLAYRDGRPMGPQWSMLAMTGVVWALNRRW